MKRSRPFVAMFILAAAVRGFAGPPEVRFDLILVESFDGAAIEFMRPSKIPIVDVDASSYLSDRYDPSRLIDGDTGTAWIEGVDGYGIGESVWLKVDRVPRVVEIWPGFQRSRSIFLRNARPARLRLTFVGNDPEVGDPYFEIFSYEVDLFRGYGGRIDMQPQFIYVSDGDILHNMALTTLVAIEIEILGVDSSEAIDPDMGISETRLYEAGDVVGVRAFGDW